MSLNVVFDATRFINAIVPATIGHELDVPLATTHPSLVGVSSPLGNVPPPKLVSVVELACVGSAK